MTVAADQAAEELARVLGDAWDSIEAKRVRVERALRRLRRRETLARLEELLRAVEAFQVLVERQARGYAETTLPAEYAAGARASAGSFTWTAFHVEAVTLLATDGYHDLLARSVEAGRTSEAYARQVREVLRRGLPLAATGDETATSVAQTLRRQLEERAVTVATYRDGSRHSMREYVNMAVRTKTASAYNYGSVGHAAEAGVGYVEVFDGSACGWTSHADPDRANGSIRTTEAAYSQVISHPNCRRAFGSRPDLATRRDAEQALPSTTEAQRDDQRLAEVEQVRTVTRRRTASMQREAARLRRFS